MPPKAKPKVSAGVPFQPKRRGRPPKNRVLIEDPKSDSEYDSDIEALSNEVLEAAAEIEKQVTKEEQESLEPIKLSMVHGEYLNPNITFRSILQKLYENANNVNEILKDLRECPFKLEVPDEECFDPVTIRNVTQNIMKIVNDELLDRNRMTNFVKFVNTKLLVKDGDILDIKYINGNRFIFNDTMRNFILLSNEIHNHTTANMNTDIRKFLGYQLYNGSVAIINCIRNVLDIVDSCSLERKQIHLDCIVC